jgi:integrase
MAEGKGRRVGFGGIEKQRNGTYRVRYVGPDGVRRSAPTTFKRKADARRWLDKKREEIEQGRWRPEGIAAPMTFEEYAASWMAQRELKPRTRTLYAGYLKNHVAPVIGGLPLAAINDDVIDRLIDGIEQEPTKKKVYGFLHGVFTTAHKKRKVMLNPCNIDGGSTPKRKPARKLPTYAEVEIARMELPPQHRLMVDLCLWCGFRFGELVGLRRTDIDLEKMEIVLREAVAYDDGKPIIDTTKGDEDERLQVIPPHIVGRVQEHLNTFITGGRDGLLFTNRDGGYLKHNNFYGKAPASPDTPLRKGWTERAKGYGWKRARAVIGWDTLHFHDLLHCAGTWYAQHTDASTREVMDFRGHKTLKASLAYQHRAEVDRKHDLAAQLSAAVETGAIR